MLSPDCILIKNIMLNRVWTKFNYQLQSSQQRWTGKIARLALLIMLLPGCTQIQSLSFFRWSEVGLEIKVSDTDTPGIYSISGNTNLPENTQLSIAAVRYLNLTEKADRPSDSLNPNPTYSILAYEPAVVKQGQWQTDLNLWRVAPNGRYQEIWQIEQNKLGLSLQPDENVVFLATLTPIDELSELEQDLAKRGARLNQGTVLSTSEGFRYAQVQQALDVALPTGGTAPDPEDDNFGWGDRYIIPQEPQNPTDLEFPAERLTNAPPKPEELLR